MTTEPLATPRARNPAASQSRSRLGLLDTTPKSATGNLCVPENGQR